MLTLLLLLATASAQFARLGDANALANTSKPADAFSVQDKLLPCNNELVLVDLDSDLAVNCMPPSCPPEATLQQCSSSAASLRIQQWAQRAAGPGGLLTQLSLAAPPPYFFADGTCLDQGGVFVNVSVYPWHCRDPTDSSHSNQWFTIANGRFYSNATGAKYKPGLCMTAGRPGVAAELEAGITMQACDDADDAQSFEYNAADGTVRHTPTGLCVDAGVIGRTVVFDGSKWVSRRIIPHACPEAGNPALLPRDRVGTYTVGRTAIDGDPAKGDRLLVIGGDDSSNNVFWSDNCGVDWFCFDGDQPWTTFGLSFAPVITLDSLPGEPLILAGGLENTVSGAQPNRALFYTFDGGADSWERGYDLPVDGVFPGAITQDRTTVYVFGGSSSGFAVWTLDEGNYNTTGFQMVPGSANAQGADVGRRVFIGGSASGGCFFATDFSPGDLWASQRAGAPITSSNTFFVAREATGPWLPYSNAPWAARASAAVVTSRDGTRVYVAGGVGFDAGVPTGETFSDVWSVDASVCLLSPTGAICSGHGTADLSSVSCVCDAAWQGDDRCGTCTLGLFGPTCGSSCPSGNGFCNSGSGWGVCDPVQGCTCSGQRANGPAGACDACLPSYYGVACAACPNCDPVHTVGGVCDGSGTNGGTGRCVCRDGYLPPLCSAPAPSPSPSGAPAADSASASAAAVSPGAAAAASLFAIALAAAGGVFVYGRFFGGGPRLASLWDSLSASVGRAATKVGNGSLERTSLLGAARVPVSPEAAAGRFGSLATVR